MNERTVVLIVGYGGAVLGLLGAALGSYFELRHAKAKRPRPLAVAAVWAALCGFAALAFVVVPRPYRSLAWLGIALLWLGLVVRSRRQQRLQGEVSQGV